MVGVEAAPMTRLEEGASFLWVPRTATPQWGWIGTENGQVIHSRDAGPNGPTGPVWGRDASNRERS